MGPRPTLYALAVAVRRIEQEELAAPLGRNDDGTTSTERDRANLYAGDE